MLKVETHLKCEFSNIFVTTSGMVKKHRQKGKKEILWHELKWYSINIFAHVEKLELCMRINDTIVQF